MTDGSYVCSVYGHLGYDRITAGQHVRRGQQIGTIGASGPENGYSDGSHLHLGIHEGTCYDEPGQTGSYPSWCCGYTPTYPTNHGWIKPSDFIVSRCTIPLAGDWNGYGYDETGTYNTNTSTFYLGSDPIPFGELGDIPIIGDWDGDGIDEIGLFRPKKDHTLNEATFYLDLDNNGGQADKTIPFGPWSQDIPIAGDWDGDEDDDIGGYYPANSTFYLYIVDLNTSTASSYADVPLGQTGDIPIS